MIQYIQNEQHYRSLTDEIVRVKHTLWMGTVDLKKAYIGSANLTGAAFGMKSGDRRNFEAGIFTDEEELVEAAIAQFDEVWMGKPCKACGRKEVCKDRIA